MINNISFNGHASINLASKEDGMLKLHDALTKPDIYKSIKEGLPKDVDIQYTAKHSVETEDHGIAKVKCGFTEYVAEFYNGITKIGEVFSGRGKAHDPEFVNKFVSGSVNRCRELLSDEDKAQHKKDVINQIREKGGFII